MRKIAPKATEAAQAPYEIPDDEVIIQFQSEDGETVLNQTTVPVSLTRDQMDEVVNQLLKNEESIPYSYWLEDDEITTSLGEHILHQQREAWREKMLKAGKRFKPNDPDKIELKVPQETVIKIVYRPQAVFKVRSVTRCSSTLSGHSEAVLVVAFSPDGSKLVTGSGDCTIRVWDLHTQTACGQLKGHKGWVQVLSWAPNGKMFASGGRDTKVIVWDGDKFTKKPPLTGHTKLVSSISWEPLHRNLACDRFVTASHDGLLAVWKTTGKAGLGDRIKSLSGHTAAVKCVKWGGEGYVYSASQDRTLIVWDPLEGTQVHKLEGHAHWVNFMALNTDVVLRTGAFDHTDQIFETAVAAQAYALERYQAVVKKTKGERLVSCSDDNTLFLWNPTKSNKPIARMVGHQNTVNHVSFSPDGHTIASASFDKSIKLWTAQDGKYITSLRGHVQCVYSVAWSSDSRLILSGSKDSTLKVWSNKTKKLLFDLPGHSDEVYAADWSPDGQFVASGSKDKTVKIWCH